MNKKTLNQLIIKTDEKNKNLIIVKEKLRIFALNYGVNDNFWAFKSKIKKVQVSDWYSVDDIVNISLIENSVSKTKGNLGKIIATGLLFGPIGAVAGSIPTGSNRIDKISYAVRFELNDIKLSVVDLLCEDYSSALRVINSLKILTKKVKK